ncbi:hypothetical protein C9374_011733 [Naegleria lovaniensis]|uniref:Uncharacterized protein n=1 Tax=Naegleria lovaniensis TaxID=51637 RepID=A0AA88KD44_NAELO|nr:uncharacterized protein C9374_011733 [Naegleria lovaniensis]KAG2373848.1 hypothetical protein C9374_011733 [Naegleria lovaniensis]
MHLPQPLLSFPHQQQQQQQQYPLEYSTPIRDQQQPLYNNNCNEKDSFHHPHSLLVWATHDLTSMSLCSSMSASNASSNAFDSHSLSSSSRSNSPQQQLLRHDTCQKVQQDEIFENIDEMIRSYYCLNTGTNGMGSQTLNHTHMYSTPSTSMDHSEEELLKQVFSHLRQDSSFFPMQPLHQTTSNLLQTSSSMTTPHENPNGSSGREDMAMFQLIDEVLKDCPSSLGLKWSSNAMLQQQQPSVSSMTLLNVSDQKQLSSSANHLKTTESQYCSSTSTMSPQSSPQLGPIMNHGKSSQKKTSRKKQVAKSLSTSSSPCLSTTSTCTDYSTSTASPSLGKISKPNKLCRNGSNSNYRVRFGHNMFEEITFKKTNPNSKFIIFK